jgi:hypothetical protein
LEFGVRQLVVIILAFTYIELTARESATATLQRQHHATRYQIPLFKKKAHGKLQVARLQVAQAQVARMTRMANGWFSARCKIKMHRVLYFFVFVFVLLLCVHVL